MKIYFTKSVFTAFLLLFYAGLIYGQAGGITYYTIHVASDKVDWDIDAIAPTSWGGVAPAEGITGDLVAVRDTSAEDSLATYFCDTIVLNEADIAGKIALISRGDCEFGFKIKNAEHYGATAVIIGNRSPIGWVVGGSAVGLINMGAGALGATVVVPAYSINYEDSRMLRLLLEEGPVTLTIKADYAYDAAAAYAYRTPQENIVPLKDMAVALQNLAPDTAFNVSVSLDITDPNGSVTTFSEVIDTLVGDSATWSTGTEVIVHFADVYQPAELGEYHVRYYVATEDEIHPINGAEDTTSFWITDDHTLAVDNGIVANPIGLALYNQAYTDDGNSYGAGIYFRTGEDGAVATHASFAISNPDELEDGLEFEANIYAVDENADGRPDSVLGVPVSISTYVFDKSAVVANEPILIELDGAANLDANGYYLLMIQTDGSSVDNYIAPGFTAAGGFVTPSLKAAVTTDSIYEMDGWESWNDNTDNDGFTFPHGGRTPMIGLHLDGFVGTDLPLLHDNEVSVFPTPADAFINLKLNLTEKASVSMAISDFNGKIIQVSELGNLQSGIIPVNVSNFASGTYFLTVKTEYGFRCKSFVVTH